MGEPIKIIDLATQMIKLSGFNKDDIKIQFSGLRPGEKLYEELFSDSESSSITAHPKIKVASSGTVYNKSVKELLKWVINTAVKDERLIKKELEHWVRGYSSSQNKKHTF